MDGWTALVGVVIGAVLAGGAQVVVEYYKRQDDRRGIASAVAGEVAGIIFTEQARQLSVQFSTLSVQLRAGTAPPPPWAFHDASYEATPVLQAYMSRIGSLGGKLPAEVAYFYSLYDSVRLDIKILAGGFYNNDPAAAAGHIDRAVALWRVAEPEGKKLIADLQSICGERPDD
jgi:hypothetical protein